MSKGTKPLARLFNNAHHFHHRWRMLTVFATVAWSQCDTSEQTVFLLGGGYLRLISRQCGHWQLKKHVCYSVSIMCKKNLWHFNNNTVLFIGAGLIMLVQVILKCPKGKLESDCLCTWILTVGAVVNYFTPTITLCINSKHILHW